MIIMTRCRLEKLDGVLVDCAADVGLGDVFLQGRDVRKDAGDEIRTHDIHVGNVMDYGSTPLNNNALQEADSELVPNLVAQSEIGTTATPDTFYAESQSHTGKEVRTLSIRPNSDESTEIISQRKTEELRADHDSRLATIADLLSGMRAPQRRELIRGLSDEDRQAIAQEMIRTS